MPASPSARSSSRPAGPTNGSPLRSSWSPGCSPTKTTRAVSGPSPKTVCVAGSHSSHAVHPAAALRRPSRPTPAGTCAGELRSLMHRFDCIGGGWDPAAAAALYGPFLESAGPTPVVATVVLDEGDGAAQFARWADVLTG